MYTATWSQQAPANNDYLEGVETAICGVTAVIYEERRSLLQDSPEMSLFKGTYVNNTRDEKRETRDERREKRDERRETRNERLEKRR